LQRSQFVSSSCTGRFCLSLRGKNVFLIMFHKVRPHNYDFDF
jgi:hypothetical protein